MGARQKLNTVNFIGCAAVAGIVGAVFQSWLVFLMVMVTLVVCHLHSGDIRFKKPRQ